MNQNLVEQTAFIGVDHPQPQQRVDHGRAHSRQQPRGLEERAEAFGNRRRDERQQQRKRHVEDTERGENEDRSDDERSDQP